MELHSMTERWSFGDEVAFDCTVIIFQHGDDYFSATSERRQNEVDVKVCATLNPRKIPVDHIFPPYESDLTKFTGADCCDVFVKRPRLTAYKNSNSISLTLLNEAHICERLSDFPHTNIACYRGCITQHGRITGLCFDKYAETVWERLHRGKKIGIRCLEQIEAGLQHLHGLGLVHCDIGDDNIMFRELDGDDLVVIDFDSCVKEGAPLPAKRGPVPDGIYKATFSIDLVAMEAMRNLAS
ncbi:hypothetical protein EJ07DRAFT_167550 [Lizonia empirigonia]|nr:hypothetical protein EJ07DRAFT_167550 [Lizonia empirigonia]